MGSKIAISKCAAFKFVLLSNLLCLQTSAQQPPSISNNYTSETNIPKLTTQRTFVYKPEKDWLYSHHPYINFFNNQFIAMWSNGMKDEDAPGQRVVVSFSKDFKTWTMPAVLSDPRNYNDTTKNVLTAAVFHQFKDTIVAYYGEYSPSRTNTKLWAKKSADGIHWSEAVDLHLPVNANLGPQKINSGRLIICGNFSFGYTDDPKGIEGWKMTSFYPDSLYKEDNPATFYKPAEKSGFSPLCETSFFQTDDNKLHALLRVTGKGWKGKLWLTESADNGASWSSPVETAFSDNDSKFHFGRMPDKQFYYVGIPDTLHHYDRNPLVLSTSLDGKKFNRNFIIANSLYQLKKEGLWKGGQYGYPFTIVHNGFMYVIISRQKETVEAIRFKLDQLK